MAEACDFIIDIREYDVPYHVRVAIDQGNAIKICLQYLMVADKWHTEIRIGKWYTVEAKHGIVSFTCIEDRLKQAEPVVLAWDIETTKLPLKFPDASIDQIMMISYMIEGSVSLPVLRIGKRNIEAKYALIGVSDHQQRDRFPRH